MLIISFTLILLYWFILLILVMINEGDKQTDYLLVFGIVSSPLAVVLFYLISAL